MTTGDAEDTRARDAWIALHDALVDAIRIITPKEVCYRLGINAQYLSDAINGKNSKGLRAEWIPHLLSMAPPDARAAILRAQAEHFGFEVERKKVLTPEQENVAIKDALKRLAPAVLALVEKEIGK